MMFRKLESNSDDQWCWSHSILIVIAVVLLQGCADDEISDPENQVANVTEVSSSTPSPEVMEKWSRSCAQCHVAGQAGAPITGNTKEWSPRLEQGRAILLDHTIKGFNMMPALGYCMSCEESDFVAMIEFMSGSPLQEKAQ